MESLPKDVLALIALDMDIEYVIRLCQSSPVFNNKICKNDYFWLNKLQKDYGISTNVSDAKEEYLTVKHLLQTDPNVILESGINSENFKLVRGAVEAWADINRKIRLYYPITLASVFASDDIFIYLMHKTDLTKMKGILANIFNYNEDNRLNKNHKCRMMLKLYGILFPYAVDYLPNPQWKIFWRSLLTKFEEIRIADKNCMSDEFYKKWIDFYRKQAD